MKYGQLLQSNWKLAWWILVTEWVQISLGLTKKTELIIFKPKHQLKVSGKIQLHTGEKTVQAAWIFCEELGCVFYVPDYGPTGKCNIQCMLLIQWHCWPFQAAHYNRRTCLANVLSGWIIHLESTQFYSWLVTQTHKYVTPVVNSLHWLPVKDQSQFKIMVYVHKTLHRNAIQYFIKSRAG